MDAIADSRIFCSPTSAETFLGGTTIGNSKPRSLSVPEITLMNDRSDSSLYNHSLGLTAILEEELDSGVMSKRQSLADLTSPSILMTTPFSPMSELLSLDTEMNALPTWTTEI